VPYIGFAFVESALDFLDSLAPKIRKQVAKRAKALHTDPYPHGSKKLHDVETAEGDPVYRVRSGDYRILYIVRSKPNEVLIIDIDDRKDVYRMPKTNTKPADEMRLKESNFDDIMGKALSVPAPIDDVAREPKRLSSYPTKPRKKD
jgi:mRNA interferase RelE/StbE